MLKWLWQFLVGQYLFYVEPAAGAPAAGAPAGAPAAGAPAAGAPAGAAPEWYAGFENPEVRDWVKAYGGAYPNPEAMATKAWNLEKLVGAEKAGKSVIVPDFTKAKPEEVSAFWRRVGASEKVDGYKVPDTLKTDPLIAKFAAQAHKVGMPVTHFNETLKWYEGEIKGLQTTQMNEFEAKAEAELNATYKEWGDKKDQNIEMGRRAAAAFIPHENPEQLEEILNRMEGALGTKLTLNLWAAIGAGIGEHGFPADSSTGGNPGGMSPEAARIRIAALKGDKEWQKKFVAGDVDAKVEWKKLHELGYSGEAVV